MTTYDKYEIIQTLGEGTFGKVKLAVFEGQKYAIKFSTKNNVYSPQVLENIFEKQSSILNQLDHPNIIKLHQVIKAGAYCKQGHAQYRSGLVFQYAPYNLGQILEFGALGQPIARTLFVQMIHALSYLHSQNIIHRDIKPQNILFDDHYNIKVADFGLSTKLQAEGKPKTICGSDSFKSPELLMKKNYNGIMNDLFAAAVTLFILVSGKAPFINSNPNTGFYKFIALNYIDKFWSSHEKKIHFSPDLKNLLTSMFAFDPTHRLTISEILSHPWVTGDILMGDQLENEMKRIQKEILQKKRKNMLKKLQDKNIFVGNNEKRGSNEKTLLLKREYNRENAKLSDRFVPSMNCFEDLQDILTACGGDIRIEGHTIYLTKIQNQQAEKIVIQIAVEKVDTDCDCLKFKLREGDMLSYVETLQLLDASSEQ